MENSNEYYKMKYLKYKTKYEQIKQNKQYGGFSSLKDNIKILKMNVNALETEATIVIDQIKQDCERERFTDERKKFTDKRVRFTAEEIIYILIGHKNHLFNLIYDLIKTQNDLIKEKSGIVILTVKSITKLFEFGYDKYHNPFNLSYYLNEMLKFDLLDDFCKKQISILEIIQLLLDKGADIELKIVKEGGGRESAIDKITTLITNVESNYLKNNMGDPKEDHKLIYDIKEAFIEKNQKDKKSIIHKMKYLKYKTKYEQIKQNKQYGGFSSLKDNIKILKMNVNALETEATIVIDQIKQDCERERFTDERKKFTDKRVRFTAEEIIYILIGHKNHLFNLIYDLIKTQNDLIKEKSGIVILTVKSITKLFEFGYDKYHNPFNLSYYLNEMLKFDLLDDFCKKQISILEIIQLLLDKGADIELQFVNGGSAIDKINTLITNVESNYLKNNMGDPKKDHKLIYDIKEAFIEKELKRRKANYPSG